MNFTVLNIFHQVLTHKVWFRDSIIHITVFTETDEEGVNGHFIDREKAGGNEIRNDADCSNWKPDIINVFIVLD